MYVYICFVLFCVVLYRVYMIGPLYRAVRIAEITKYPVLGTREMSFGFPPPLEK